MSSSSRRTIGTRSKSRDEMDAQQAPAAAKENVQNDQSNDFQPPSPSTATPSSSKREMTKASSTAKTSRSAASLFSPPSEARRAYSDSMKKQPDPFPDNWEEDMGVPSSASRRSRREGQQDSFATPYSMSQAEARTTDPRSDDRRMMVWEPRSEGGRGNNNSSYGSLAADLDMAARGDGVDDFPAVADCLNLGSFAEESPPRAPRRRSPKASPQRYEQGQPYPYRSSPPPPPQQQQYPPGSGPPPMYYQGGPPPPPAGSPYAYPPQGPYPPYRGYPQQPPPHGEQPPPWTSPPAQQFHDYPPPERSSPRRSPPPKKRRNWDSNSSSPEGSTTPEKVFPEKPSTSPFRSPVPEKGSTKKYKRSPLFPGGTPGIAQFGSWDTPGGTLNALHGATLGDEFSPMGPSSFAPFGDDSPLQEGEAAPMPFDAKLDLARSDSGEDAAASRPPAIRQRTTGQPAASPFSSFVGELSPFPPHMRGSPVGHDPRDYAAPRNHPGHPAYHRPPEEFPRHPGMPTPAKRSRGPPSRPAHPMASPVMSTHGSSQRQQPWYPEHVAPSPGPFRLELGETPGKTRKGFEDINSLLRGANGPPPPHPRPSPPGRQQRGYDSGGRPGSASRSSDLNTPIKAEGGPPGGRVPGSVGRVPFPGSAMKVQTPRGSRTTPRFTPLMKSKGTAATPGSKTPGSGGRGGPTPTKKKQRRHPCNCKKSRCLKLYCECFAGELYCDGCNCNDCHNTTAYEPERQKAMKDTRAKNPNAFKARISVRTPSGAATTPAGGHNMGCKCKKSECLKKYCECFQAGVMCATKCKCVDCLNYVGSQALIDKRRKMKDHRGAEFAMRIADEAWKGGKHAGPPRGMNPRGMAQPSPSGPHRGHPMPMPNMMQPGPSPHHRGPPPPHYMGPMMGHPHMGYSPMGMPPMTPGYVHGKQQMLPPSGGRRAEVTRSAPPKEDTKQKGRVPKTNTITPRTPAVRLGFDPHSSKKKRKLSLGAKEPTFPFFGDRPEQPKTTALAILSYLSNDELFNAGLVCKQWSKLATDDELWQF